MTNRVNAVTGATGLIGSHIAELLIARGERVRALVRPGSNTDFLRQLGAELIAGDLQNLTSVCTALAGAEVVFHTAARVGDWGTKRQYAGDIIDGTSNVVKACRVERVAHLVHFSSLAVYGEPAAGGGQITEEAPLGQGHTLWDYYGQAKRKAEELVRTGLPTATILRPSWTYGPRDRNTIARVTEALLAGKVPIIGRGDNHLNVLYASDVADAAILAANCPAARGRVYNLSSDGEATQLQMLNAFTDILGLPRIRRSIPLRLVLGWASLLEFWGRLLRRSTPPAISVKAVRLISRSTRYSTAKARQELNWQPQIPIDVGLRRTLAWYYGDKRDQLAALRFDGPRVSAPVQAEGKPPTAVSTTVDR